MNVKEKMRRRREDPVFWVDPIDMMILRGCFFVFIVFFFFAGGTQAEVITVGPGQDASSLKQVRWDRLRPGDEVRIKARSKPYREKIVLKRSGRSDRPIRITGVPDQDGHLPVLDGENAVHFQARTDVKLSRRAIIIAGGSHTRERADFVVIENLELRNANNTASFRQNGAQIRYADNGAGIYVNRGDNVVIKGCRIHSCCMGVQTAYAPDVKTFVLTGNIIYNNGDFTRTHWAHNVYLGAGKSLVEFNRFGELVSDGNNIKDRSGFTVIRYNWIEGGMSRQIDLVETKKYPSADAYVYGNVIVSGQRTKNPKMVLFGGDAGERSSRRGTLYFFNNTLHFKQRELHGFVWINRTDCRVILTNNVFLGGNNIWLGPGRASGFNNMIGLKANHTGLTSSFTGSFEQMQYRKDNPYLPKPGSILINNGFLKVPKPVRYVPLPWPGKRKRPHIGVIDIGAYEF